MINRRQLGVTAAAVLGGSTLAACSGSKGSTKAPSGRQVSLRPDGNPDLKWTGTITMGAQAYTPALTGVKLAPGSRKLKAFGEIAAEFQKLYPGITIKFLGSEYTYDPNLMKTQATGGQLPDVWWQQTPVVNTSFPAGVATNMLGYMESPNPFVKDNAKWRDLFSAEVFTTMMADDKTQYANNADYVGTAFFYNEQIFTDAGITAPPKTYAELLQICQTLKDKGHMPSALPGYTYGFSWLVRLFLPNFLGEETVKKIDAYSAIPGISVTDIAVAWHNGIIDPRKNDAVLAWWPHAKDFFAFCDPQITQLPANPPAGSPNPEALFAAGKVAMIYDGTWAPGAVSANESSIKVGSFPFPNLAGSDAHATDFDTSNAVGGPFAAWQYFVSTAKSDSSLKTEGKLDAVIAWVQYFSTPERNSKICNENGSFLPTMTGATPLSSMKDLSVLASKPLYSIQGGAEFTTQSTDQINKLFQQYVQGQVSMDQVTSQYPTIIDKGFNDYVKQHKIDFSKYPA